MEKLLITGANGFVGSRIAHAVHTHYDLLTPSHSECDITSAKAVEVYVRQHRPQAILHLAALSNTGYCEEHPEASYQVNVVGVENIAAAAARFDAKLVFFSSDQVYNGNCEQGLLSEEITLSPENHYGRHKRMAEVRALQLCPNSVALRATWMYDNTREGMPTHNNFVRNIKEALRLHTPYILPHENIAASHGSTKWYTTSYIRFNYLVAYTTLERRTPSTPTRQPSPTSLCCHPTHIISL